MTRTRPMTNPKPRPLADAPALLSRREATRTLLYAFGGATLFACSGGGGIVDNESSSATEDGGTGTDDPSKATTGDGGTTTGSGAEWASGGTKSMTAAASYPNPFA